MSQTSIFTSRKLEKLIKEFVVGNKQCDNEFLGDWTSTLLYVSHKKCWLIINKPTKYVLVLPDVKKIDLKNIASIFKKTFHQQLNNDEIEVDYSAIDKIIGSINLYETDNDRSINGSLNNIMLYFEEWKYEFGHFENMPFIELCGRLNTLPNQQLNWLSPKEKMKKAINAYTMLL